MECLFKYVGVLFEVWKIFSKFWVCILYFGYVGCFFVVILEFMYFIWSSKIYIV